MLYKVLRYRNTDTLTVIAVQRDSAHSASKWDKRLYRWLTIIGSMNVPFQPQNTQDVLIKCMHYEAAISTMGILAARTDQEFERALILLLVQIVWSFLMRTATSVSGVPSAYWISASYGRRVRSTNPFDMHLPIWRRCAAQDMTWEALRFTIWTGEYAKGVHGLPLKGLESKILHITKWIWCCTVLFFA